jgi:hypothetical protein
MRLEEQSPRLQLVPAIASVVVKTVTCVDGREEEGKNPE